MAVTLPNSLVAGTNENVADVQENFETLRDFANTPIPDTGLLSPNSGVWRTVEIVPFNLIGALSSGVDYWIDVSAGTAKASAAAAATGFPGFYLPTADFAVASKTTQLRLTVAGYRNATAWGGGANAVFNLYPVSSVAGTAGNITPTLGATAGSATISAPSTSVAVHAEGTAFTAPAAGSYALGVFFQSAVSANAVMTGRVSLQMRHI